MRKKAMVSKMVVLLCTTTLLFACSKDDDLVFTNEIDTKQVVLDQVNEDVFVDLNKATEVADLFFGKLTGTSVSTRSGGSSVQTLSDSVRPLMYVVNYADGGFVIMGATQNYYPVLAYSDKGSFEITPEMSGVSVWLEETKGAIQVSDTFNDSIKANMQGLWRSYEIEDTDLSQSMPQTRSGNYSDGELACQNKCMELIAQYGSTGWMFIPLSYVSQWLGSSDVPLDNIVSNLTNDGNYFSSSPEYTVFGFRFSYDNYQVGPLLTTHWHQGFPFNNFLGGLSAGCGPIAVAQVMKYYQHPPMVFTLDNNYSFSWSTIPDDVDPNSDQDAFVRVVGAFIGTNYSSGGYTTPGDMEEGLQNLLYNVDRGNYNSQKVISEIFSHRPVIMLGNDDNLSLFPDPLNYLNGSHYWVCDGARRCSSIFEYFSLLQPNGNGTFVPGAYSKDSPYEFLYHNQLYFHMNWGWGNFEGENAWYINNDVDSRIVGNYQYSRDDFYISVD
jgi:hypothetical protein